MPPNLPERKSSVQRRRQHRAVEAHRIAVNIAKLPVVCAKRD